MTNVEPVSRNGHPLIQARGLVSLRRLRRRRRHRLRPPARGGVRLPRAERRGQDVDDADDRLRLARFDGTLSVLGLDPARDGVEIRGRLGVVPQLDTLDMELTVRENVVIYGRYFGLSRKEIASRADELLEFVELTERANDRVEPLSGGMKRRLRSRARSSTSPRCSCSTSRRLGSTRRRGMSCGIACPAEASGRDAAPDDALHGRGRAAVRPPCRDGQGQDRRRGLAARAHRALLHARGRRAPLRRLEPTRRLRLLDGGSSSAVSSRSRTASSVHGRRRRRVHQLHERGLVPESLLVRRSTLEDVFLHLTGRSLID